MIINLTPHTISMVNDNGEVVRTIESSGVARAEFYQIPVGEVEEIPLVVMAFGKPMGIPMEVEKGTYYIVSLATANACKECGRDTSDLLLTANTVRDENGRIIGCKNLAVF